MMHSFSERRMMILWSSCLIFSLFNSILVFASPARHLCRPDQRDALWEFKSEFSIQESYSNTKTEKWRNNTDCCSWDGVSCDPKTGEVVELYLGGSYLNGSLRSNSSLFRLQHLQSLDFYFNNLSSGGLPDSIGNLKHLRVLSLTACGLFGKIPSSLGNLSYLTHLSINGNAFTGELPDSMGNLNQLTKLNFAVNKLSGNFPPMLLNLSELTYINLAYNQFKGMFPSNLSSLSKLESFDISRNSFSGSIPPSLFVIFSLIHLDLSRNDFSGPLEIMNISSPSKLITLSLGENNFSGPIPGFISKLVGLQSLDLSFWNTERGMLDFSIFMHFKSLGELDLSGNNLKINSTLHLPSLITSLSLASCNLSKFPQFLQAQTRLETLDISANQIEGQVPEWLWRLPLLQRVIISQNSFSGFEGSADVIQRSGKLELLDISSNSFEGPFPLLPNSTLDILGSNNRFSGEIPRTICQLVSLTALDLSNNNFSGLNSCNLFKFPEFAQTRLVDLDISANQIEGQVPEWLWRLPLLERVNISQNSFSGFEGSADVIQRSEKLRVLDITSNSFEGPFPLLPNSTVVILGSNNRFSGEIPRTICQLVSLLILDLSNNNFSGSIPQCFNTSLEALNLRNNSLCGILPEEFIGVNLISLDVGHNRLSGELPKSLINSTNLMLLNVEENRFNDTFTILLILLPNLLLLVLRSNEFHGPIYSYGDSLSFPKLQIFDISENRFSGVLPSDYFAGWSGMSSVSVVHFAYGMRYGSIDSVVVTNKGLKMKLVGRILGMYKIIDVSRNKFEGDIPKSIGLLKGLIMLNMSNNAFTGRIPQSLANLTNIESLDLSQNRLSGKIPPALGNLTFLARMNFSCNRLEGPIPQGTQIQSQNSSSFAENPGLCGAPLQKTCGRGGEEEEATNQEEDEEKDQVLSWVAAAIGYIPGVFCGLTISHILTSYKHDLFMRIFHYFT